MPIAMYYDEEKNEGEQFIPGVPLADMTEEQYEALPDWLKQSVDESPLYRKTKPKGWKAPAEAAPEPEPAPAEGQEG